MASVIAINIMAVACGFRSLNNLDSNSIMDVQCSSPEKYDKCVERDWIQRLNNSKRMYNGLDDMHCSNESNPVYEREISWLAQNLNDPENDTYEKYRHNVEQRQLSKDCVLYDLLPCRVIRAALSLGPALAQCLLETAYNRIAGHVARAEDGYECEQKCRGRRRALRDEYKQIHRGYAIFEKMVRAAYPNRQETYDTIDCILTDCYGEGDKELRHNRLLKVTGDDIVVEEISSQTAEGNGKRYMIIDKRE
jgi:hypothetical protein